MSAYTRITKRKLPKERSTTGRRKITPWMSGSRIDYDKEITDGLISYINQDKATKQIPIEYKIDFDNVLSEKPTQRRFQGRLVLLPEFNINDYKCRAVIDFVEFLIVTDNDMSENRLRNEFTKATGRSPRVEFILQNKEDHTKIFTVRIQDLDLKEIETLLPSKLGGKRRELFDLGIISITVFVLEVSVDFYTKEVGDTFARRKMVGILARHYFPPASMVKDELDAMRVIRSDIKSPKRLDQLFPSIKDAETPIKRDPLENNLYVKESTIYLGKENSTTSRIRIMEKVKDKQNKKTGTLEHLAVEKQRARIEVTLRESELQGLGINNFVDLSSFDFSKLQHKYFDFKLPTIPISQLNASDDRADDFDLEADLLDIFLNMGIATYQREKMRSRLVAHKIKKQAAKLKGDKVSLPRKYSRNTNMAAYTALNKRINEALCTLSS